jgi:cysteine desulfurase/selenocysteine lyase
MERSNFPLLAHSNIAYLDNASTTQKPQAVIDAITATYTTFNANPGRAIYALAEEAATHYAAARTTVARFINAHPEEVIFVRGATEGINAIAHGWALLQLKAGDEIVLSELEHHANLVPWQRVAQKTGATLKFIPINADGMLCYEVLPALITPKTKLVAITHCSNVIGVVLDLAPIVAAAKSVGACILVDASQSAPHMRIDVTQLAVDALVFSGHKILGPTGSGVLYIKKSFQPAVEPWMVGGGSVADVGWYKATLRSGPEKFEAGTVSLAQAVGLAAAITYLELHVPFDVLQRHEAALCAQLIEGLLQYPRIKILGPLERMRTHGHMVTFVVEGIHPHDVAAFLDRKGICVRAGTFCAQPLMERLGYPAAIRASFYCYSTREDVDRLLAALATLLVRNA